MALFKLKDFHPDYRETLGGEDIKGFDVYTTGDEKVGTVADALVDEEGRFRYLVVDTGFWIFGKKVLLPVGRSHINRHVRRIYISNLSKAQAEDLPQYDESMVIDYDYEERVRRVYRSSPLETDVPLEASAPLDDARPLNLGSGTTPFVVEQPAPDSYNNAAPVLDPLPHPATTAPPIQDRGAYTYQQDPTLYDLNDRDHQTLKLFEERLIADKNRAKVGEVSVGKRVETEIAKVAVPVEKERIVIERSQLADAEAVIFLNSGSLQTGELARIELYEEIAAIHKESFVREEVRLKKEIAKDVVSAEATLRQEKLDVTTEGHPIVNDRSNDSFRDRM